MIREPAAAGDFGRPAKEETVPGGARGAHGRRRRSGISAASGEEPIGK